MVSETFLIDNFFLVSLERNDLYLTFKSNTFASFDVIPVFFLLIKIYNTKYKSCNISKINYSFKCTFIEAGADPL